MVLVLKINNIKKTILLFGELIRIRNGVIAFFGVLVGAALVYTTSAITQELRVLVAGFVALLITGAGNAINDYFDYEIDKINKPHRPIPSGRISRSDVFMLSIILFLLGLGLAKYVNDYCLSIAFLNSIILIFYAMYSKKLLLVSNLGISYLVASIFLFGVAATIQEGTSMLSIEEIKIVTILTACAFFMTFSREIIKDIEDIKGDKEKYAVTLPIKIGVKRAKNMAIILTLIAIAFSLLPFAIETTSFNVYAYGTIIIISDLIFLASLTMHPTLGQRLMVVGMLLALTAFFLGNIANQTIT